MNEQGPGTEDVECTEIVHRALKKRWADGTQVHVEAFIRKINRDTGASEEALSLSRKKYATARECRLKLKKMPASASLHSGTIRELPLNLDVRPDPLRDTNGTITEPDHCLLVNLPDPVNDYDSAEFAASQLSEVARVVTQEQEEQEHQERRGP
jgi:hypothetical protein